MLSIISDSLLIQTSFCAMPSGGEEFKVPLPLTFCKKKVAKFQGLPHFKWDDLGTQDVIGQGSFGAVLRVCSREDQAEVTHATAPISLKLAHMIKVIKLFKNPK